MSKALSSPVQLAKSSWQLTRQHAKVLLGISAAVGVPATFISTYLVDPSSDSSISAYVALAQLSVNAALIYAVIGLMDKKKVGIRQAYYQGSVLLVRLILFSFLMLLYAIPVILGLVLLSFGVLAPGAVFDPVESTAIGAVAVAIAIPGVILLLKGMWGAYVLGETSQGPIEALVQSHRLTKGKVWPLFGRLLGLALVLLVAVALPAGLVVGLAAITGIELLSALIQFVVVVVALPYATLYTYQLYRELKK